MARLCRPKTGPTKVETAASMIRWLAICHRGRMIYVVTDAAYHGKALRHLPCQIIVTTRLPANAVLYGVAPAPNSKRGRLGSKTPGSAARPTSPSPESHHRAGHAVMIEVIDALDA